MEQIQSATVGEMPVQPEKEVWDREDEEVLELEQNGTEEMGELPVEDWDYQRPKRGQVRSGVILAIEDQEIIVDVGVKRDGIVPFADMQRMGPEALAELSVGDEVPVYILRPEDRDGNLLVSLYLARQEKAWQRAQEMADNGHVWEGQVVGYNKGGVVVPVGEIRGFVPASQVPGFPRGLNQEERLERLATLVGETLMVKVIEINRRKRRLILSASAAQRQWRKQHRERLLEELREGEVRSGRVSSLCSFGAFVDLGGADGLIHLSELSWRRVRHPREAVSVGDEVEVYVLRLDAERKRIGLSLKRLQPEPWALVEDRYELGQLIEGVVTNVVDFGAFAEIEEGIEGLIHISELTDGSITHAREVVKRGDLLLLRIIRIDARRKRLGLSLKRVLESEWAEWAARLAVEDRGGPGAQMEEPQPPDDQAVQEPAALEIEEPTEAVVSQPVAADVAEDMVESDELADTEAELEAAEPDAIEEQPAEELEETVEAVVSERVAVEAAEDVVGTAGLDSDVELETEVLDVIVERPAEELEEPLEDAVSEPVAAGIAEDVARSEGLDSAAEPEAEGPEVVGEQPALAEVEELESEEVGVEELEVMVPEPSEDVHETPDLPDTGVEESEAAEAMAVEDPELATTEA